MQSDNSSSMDSTSNAQPTTVAQPTAPTQPPAPQPPPSRLGAIIDAVSKTINPQPAQPANNTTAQPNTPPPQPVWKKVLGTGLGVVSSALAGIPAGGRPSFLGGLGQGARAQQAAQASEQAIKFASFQDQVRAANLHNQDLQKQAADDAQTKAQQAAEDFQNEALGTAGGRMETHPNEGTSVTQTLQAQTAANGAASITPGTHVSADGKNINIPSNTPETLAAQVQNYKAMEGKLPGLPGLPPFDPSSVKTSQDVVNARAELGKHLDILQHLLQGYVVNGNPLSHKQLNDFIPAYQSQIDSLSKNGGASDYQLGTLKNTLAILQANEKHHSDKEQEVSDQATANAVDKTQQLTNIKTAGQKDVQDNAAGNKAANVKPDSNMYVGTDAAGNQVAGNPNDLKAAGVSNFTKLPTEQVSKVNAARELISPAGLFNSVAQNIQALQAKGNLGVVGSRWNDFLAGKVGEGDPDFQSLRTNMGLLSTKLMQAHVGSRGSAQMLEHFKELADYRITDAKTLLSALSAEHKYMTTTAAVPKQQTPSGGQ